MIPDWPLSPSPSSPGGRVVYWLTCQVWPLLMITCTLSRCSDIISDTLIQVSTSITTALCISWLESVSLNGWHMSMVDHFNSLLFYYPHCKYFAYVIMYSLHCHPSTQKNNNTYKSVGKYSWSQFPPDSIRQFVPVFAVSLCPLARDQDGWCLLVPELWAPQELLDT